MAVGQTYVLIDHQSYLGVSLINRYYYQHTSGAGVGANDLAQAFIQQVLPYILDIQVDDLVHTAIEVWTPDETSDFVNIPLTSGNTGQGTSDPLPAFVSYTFQFVRPFRSFRSGRKAYAGVGEGDITAGNPTSAHLLLLNDLATALVEVIAPTGVSQDFTPVLVKNLIPVPPLIREVAQIQAAQFIRVSTQSTRKD